MKLYPGAVVMGGTALNYKTGNWRSDRPVVDKEKCKACGVCVEVCPDEAAKQVEEKVFAIDYDYCKGCGLCARECPADAIAMVPEEK